MQKIRAWVLGLASIVGVSALPLMARAHEVYVLDPATIARDVAGHSPNPFAEVATHAGLFSLCILLGVILVSTIFFISISRRVQAKINPFLMRLKRYAPIVTRLTLGAALLFSAYHNALFGPELPLAHMFGSSAASVRIILYILGVAVTLGFFTRIAAAAALIIYLYAFCADGSYMLNYFNYFGEMIITLILGAGAWSLDRVFLRHVKVRQTLERLAFPALRICFGISLIFASWYAKLFHSQLALDTVLKYHLTNYFPFPPLFVVLGAMIIETLIGLFFILGFEVRFTAIFFLVFLSLSLSFFGEAVWPHVVLFGVAFAFIMHGYDRYSLERHFLKNRGEPVL